MRDWIVKNKRFLSIVGVVLPLFLFFVFAPSAHAALIDIGVKTISFFIKTILNIWQFLVGQLIKLAGVFVAWVLSINQTLVVDATRTESFVYVGWTVFRDFANLGFVLGIVIIAIATILRYKGYVAQSILWKLIVAALLVNFSLIIGVSFIRVSDVFSNFFLASIVGETPGSTSISGQAAARLTDNFKYPAISAGFVVATSTEQEDDSVIANEVVEITSIVASIIMGFLIALVLIGFGATLFLRYFYLAFLLVLAPLAWLLWIFPHTQGQWKKWWEKFIHWVLYAPAVLLFVWIALIFLTTGAETYKNSAEQVATAPNGEVADLGNVKFRDIMGSILAVGMLIGGMKVAQSMGFGGTALAMGAATKMGGWAKTRTLGIAKRTGTAIGRQAARPLEAAGRKAGQVEIKNAALRWAYGNTVGRFARGGVAVGAAAERADATQRYNHYQEKYKNYDKKRLQAIAGTLTGSEKDVVVAMLAEKDGGLNEETVRRLGGEQAIAKTKERFERFGKRKEFGNIEKALGKSAEAIEALAELDEALKGGDLAKINTARKKLQDAKDKFTKGFKDDDWRKVGKSVYGKDPSTMTDAEKEYVGMLSQEIIKDPSGKKFYRVYGSLEGNSMYDYVNQLVTQADQVKQFTGGLDQMLKDAKTSGNYSKVIEALESTGDPMHGRLAKQIKNTIVDGVAASAYGGPPGGGASPGGGGGGAPAGGGGGGAPAGGGGTSSGGGGGGKTSP